MTTDEENRPSDRAEHPQEPAEGGREEVDTAMDDTASDAEREGIVDQQDAALTAMDENGDDLAGDDPMQGEAPTG
jgi:hypothetical protein